MKEKLLFLSLCISACYLINLYTQPTNPNKALLKASITGDHDKITRLIKVQAADINTTDVQKQTPLMLAAFKDNISTVKQLLGHNPNLDVQDENGNTALMLAIGTSSTDRVTDNSYRIALIFLEHGADPTLKNKNGEKATDLVNQKPVDELSRKTIAIISKYTHGLYK